MARNALTAGGKNKKNFVEIATILQSPVMKAKLQNCIDEVLRCKTAILDKQEDIRSIREAAVDDLNIEPKMFNALVSMYFNNNFDQKLEELSKLEQAIRLIQGNQLTDDSSGE